MQRLVNGHSQSLEQFEDFIDTNRIIERKKNEEEYKKQKWSVDD